MIHFVDLRHTYEDTGAKFAFWDTVLDRFVDLGGEQAWESWDDFEQAYSCSPTHHGIDRFRLVPWEIIITSPEGRTMTCANIIRQLKDIAVEITEISMDDLDKVWPWANGLADAVDAFRAGRKLKTYHETGGHSAGVEGPPLPDLPIAPRPCLRQWRPETRDDVAQPGDEMRDRQGRVVRLGNTYAVEGWNEGPFHEGAFDIFRPSEHHRTPDVNPSADGARKSDDDR